MNDYSENTIEYGDLVVIAFRGDLVTGVVKHCHEYSLHFYPLTERGCAKAEKRAHGYIDFINAPRPARILKITPECLRADDRKYYERITKALKGNVTTADNT